MTGPPVYDPPPAITQDQPPKPKGAPWEEALLQGGLGLGTAADVGTTIAGLHQGGFHEGNPLLAPIAKAGDIPLALADAGSSALAGYASHKLREQGSPVWWLPAAAGTALHVIGALSNLHALGQRASK